jgi:hypothetical protein
LQPYRRFGEVVMFLWRSLDPRTVSSVLGWMAERQRSKASPERPATTTPRPAPAEVRAAPERIRTRGDGDRG